MSRSLGWTVASGVVIAALVGTLAVVSDGYEAQRFDLGDGSVWVANGGESVVGRANTQIAALDTVVETPGNQLDVLQSGATVLVADGANATLGIIDPASAEIVESIPLPPQAPEVLLEGDTIVIHSPPTGGVWIRSIADLASFDSEVEPDLSLGADSLVSLETDGTLAAFSSDAREVYTLDAGETDAVEQTWDADFGDASSELSLTTVGDRWALLDANSNTMLLESGEVDLEPLVGEGTAVVQNASSTGSAVLVGFDGGLISIPLSGGDPVQLVEDRAGAAVVPVVSNGCRFAAWTDGSLWRDCGDGAEEFALASVPSGSTSLAFVENGRHLVLNDPQGGASWAVQSSGELIDNWAELIADPTDDREVEENDDEVPPEFETEQVAPVAVDDEFGARPGRASVLPVLLNDYDPNGDVLVIDAVDPLDPELGRVDVINDRQRLQITLESTATGSATFGYTISDGRGGTATATVTVTVRSPEENGAPEQVRSTTASVASGASVTRAVLGDWVDPDGDTFYLAGATTAAPDLVSFKPEGTVVIQEGGASGSSRTVGLSVTDGTDVGSGSIALTVRDRGDVPIVADPFAVVAYAGQELRIRPLAHVRGGTGQLRLSSVPEKSGSTVDLSTNSGSFTFTSEQVRSHIVDYVVTDGDETATGTVRVDVQAPPDAGSTPITIPKTVFVRTLESATLPVASTDIDPAGGVLLVTETSGGGPGTGVAASVIDQRDVRVTLTAPLDDGPVTLGYSITNGLASADGTITVVEIPAPERFQPPIAADDSITVRVGDVVDIPVLANDQHPDDEELTLNPMLVTDLPRESGLVFASGSVLRYLAPGDTGNFTVVYEVAGPDGQVAQAEVAISVREVVVSTNEAPTPSRVVARVSAGETVRARIPLAGIDPDGDSVQLLGQESSPEKGSVTDVGPDYIEYLAGEYSAGTDQFSYTVIDALGARATGTVRIGISPATDTVRNPVTVEDEVTIAPGKTVSIRPLENDFDPDGGVLSVAAVEANTDDIVAEIDGDVVVVTPPEEPGRYGLVYTAQNELGGSESNFITVVVDPDAPPSYPVASDTVLGLSDILDRDEVTVDVLRNVFFADGSVRSLEVSLLPGFEQNAVVTDGDRITVEVADERQIIPFAVANPDDPTIVAYAFVRVPGLDDSLPQLDRTASALSVVSEETIEIDINDHVIAAGGREVRLVDAASVQATNADGAELVVDGTTLRFTSEDTFFGPASISFQVTDGEDADDPDGREATIVLPITVTPRENQPPVFAGASLEFEPGESRSFDLVRLTTYPYPDDTDELAYSVVSAPPEGFDFRITGSSLEITADADARTGSRASLAVGVRDEVSEGRSGRIELAVVRSTRPLAQPASDSVVAPRGRTTVVDVLANDSATNPFPGEPLRVVSIRGLSGAALPDGVRVTPSADNSRLSVTVDDAAAPIDTNLQYEVADVTGDESRYVFGRVRISVQDVPDAPVAPTRADGGYEEGQLTLRLTAPQSNNSPIAGYEVRSSSNGGYSRDCGTALRCVLTDLEPGARYSFTVVARNAIGESESSPASELLAADYLPAAPTSVTARPSASNPSGGALQISWSAVPRPSRGTDVDGYTVRVTGPGVDYTTTASRGTTSITTSGDRSFAANTQYVATVYAFNRAQVISDADWRRTSSAPVTTVGPPSQTTGGVSAVLTGRSGDIRVTWGSSSPNGAPGVDYSVGQFAPDQTVPSSCASGADHPGVASGAAGVASGWVDSAARDGSRYVYVVYADNGLFCTPTVSGAVESKVAPGAPSASVALAANGGTPGAGQLDIRVDGLTGGTGITARFEARVGGGPWTSVSAGSFLTSAANASVYGAPQTVEFRGCRDSSADFCGAPSSGETLTPINARASLVSCSPGSTPTASAPRNAGSPAVRYLYQFNDGGVLGDWSAWVESTDASAIVPDPALLGTGVTRARVQAVVTVDGGESFRDEGHDEAECR
ncbi:Ig-like domain-containing protein [Marisediminicola sp. LYQ85]|uniref:Ig-like domain-containing protein n=1 Tax=Marisediminicola sp. LYQ85 TaxID=3391062 RepID=UPI003983B9E6